MNIKKINTIKFGILGLGYISKFYIYGIRKNKNCKLISACDINKSKFKNLPSSIHYYTNYDDMIKNEDLDVIVILLPNFLHFKYIKSSLNNNLNVLCEKPLCLKIDEAEKLFLIAKKKKLLLMTAFNREYNKFMIPLIKNPDKYGDIKYIHSRYFENILKHSNGEEWYLNKKKSGGGCIIDNGTNMIHLLLNVVGDLKILKVNIKFKSINGRKIDSKALIKFKFRSGEILLELDWFHKKEVKDLLIKTDKRIVKINLLQGYKKLKSSLWHEYQNLLADFIYRLNLQNFNQNKDLQTIQLVQQLYKIS